MYQRKTRRRLFYASGLISLILLPVLGYIFIYLKYHPKKEYMMTIIMPETSISCEEIPTPPIKLFSRPDYHFILNGDKHKDWRVIDSIIYILNQNKNLDSNAFILQVTLGDNSKYWEMIKLFDVCKVLGFNMYALFDNEFRVYTSRGGRESNLDYSLPAPMLYEIKPLLLLHNEKRNIDFFIYHIKFIWPSAILFLIMLILIVWRFIRR